MNSGFLTVCITRGPDEVIDHVARWSELGMVSNVATCSLDDLIQNGTGSTCQHFGSFGVVDTSLEAVLHRQSKNTHLTLAALRPQLPDDADQMTPNAWREYRQTEVDAGKLIMRKWHPDAGSQSISVSIAREGLSLEAFSNWWNLHLVHDRRSIILPTSIVEIASEDSAAICAMTALCAGGGWTFSNGQTLRATRDDTSLDGQFKKVRIVRPEVRIVVPTDLKNRLSSVTAGGFPKLPPWPAPSDIETIQISTEVSPPGSVVDQLAGLCGFVVEPPRYSKRFNIDGWHGAHSIMRLSFSHIRGDPSEVLREWEERVWSENVDAYDDPAEDGTGGFETDNLEEALERFNRYVQDIDEVVNAIRVIDSSFWDEFDFDAAVASLRDAEMPELTLGMQHQSSKWPACWSNMRRFFFALLDGSEFPEGIDDLPLPAYASGVERPIWSDPSIVAPHPSVDSSDAFELDDDLAQRLGVAKIRPVDSLAWRRADAIINAEADPFRPIKGNREPHPCADRWSDWNGQFRRIPMVRLANRLGLAVGDAYRNLAAALRPPDDEDYEGELLHGLTLFRSVGIVSIPVALCLPIVAIVLLLAGVLFSEGHRLLSGIVVLVWLLSTVLCALTSHRLVQSTRRYAYAVSERWQWAMRVRHYALELTRLHGVARAFTDHQATVRVMLHEPFPRSDPHDAQESQLGSSDVPPDSLLVASAALDEDRWRRETQGIRPRIVSEGWLENAFDEVEAVWKEEFSRLLGTREFIDPEDDYTPPGHTRYRALGSGEPISGSREHFRAAVVNSIEARVEARVRTAMKYADIGKGQELELLGAISVDRHPVIGGSATSFLQFEESRTLDFDPVMVKAGVDPVPVDPQSCVSLDGMHEKLEWWGPDGAGTAFASWRMLVSSPCDPKSLRGVMVKTADLHRDDPEGDSHEDVT